MGIGEQFAGLDMKNLIGGPLTAAAESSVVLANSTADFINKVGFNPDKTARTVLFKFQKSDSDPLGNPVQSEMQLEVPMLAIVPIPNLQIDEVNILFDMEVRECSTSESSLDGSGSFSGEANLGLFKVKVSGSVASHSSNTRSTDNSAKYHVDVRAANHGTPEGLARVLDIMSACAAPALLASKMVDADGKPVDNAAKQKRAAVNASYQQQQQIGTACKAASDQYEAALKRFNGLVTSRLNSEKRPVQNKLNTIEDVTADPKAEEAAKKEAEEAQKKIDANRKVYVDMLGELTASWEKVSSEAREIVESVYESVSGEEKTSLMTYFALKSVKEEADSMSLEKITADDSLAPLNACFKTACKNYADFKQQEAALAEERGKYNALLMQR